MTVPLYFDVHVDHAIVGQLHHRQVDVLTAQEDGTTRFTDEDLLARASSLGRVIFTHDIRFMAMAEDWQRQGRPFFGLVYAHPMQVSIGSCVKDLELLAKATEPADWVSMVERLPL